ncbi:MAG TPA: GNAT family N-acetyltransferase [Anaerolineales bacterium]
MIAIDTDQITAETTELFDLAKPTMPRAFLVLEGLNRGEILADDPARPTWALVRDGVYGSLYFGGKISSTLVASVVQHFRGLGEVGIGCWLDDPMNDLLPADPAYDGRTLYFTERSSTSDSVVPALPHGFRLILRDERWFSKSPDYESTLASFGSLEKVLEHTLGVMILDGETLVCEAATGAPTHGLIEVGVTTAEAYRRQGFATIACAHLIELCEARGYRTWWDCAKQNTPSVKLARRLGYRNEKEYRYVWWPKAS